MTKRKYSLLCVADNKRNLHLYFKVEYVDLFGPIPDSIKNSLIFKPLADSLSEGQVYDTVFIRTSDGWRFLK